MPIPSLARLASVDFIMRAIRSAISTERDAFIILSPCNYHARLCTVNASRQLPVRCKISNISPLMPLPSQRCRATSRLMAHCLPPGRPPRHYDYRFPGVAATLPPSRVAFRPEPLKLFTSRRTVYRRLDLIMLSRSSRHVSIILIRFSASCLPPRLDFRLVPASTPEDWSLIYFAKYA